MAGDSQTSRRVSRACDVSRASFSSTTHTNQIRHAKRELVKMFSDKRPDVFFAGNVSNARIQRTGTRGSRIAKDVERRDNTACLKLRSVEGSPFVVQQPFFGRAVHSLRDPANDRGPAIGFKRRRQPSTSTEHVMQVGSSSTPVLRVPNNSLPMSATPPKLNGAQTSSSSQLPSPDSSHPPSHINNLKPSGNRDAPLLGLPRPMVDELLAAYFTHVHVGVLAGYERYAR